MASLAVKILTAKFAKGTQGALRRKPADLSPKEQGLKTTLQEWVQDGWVQIVGPVRQELLSGIRVEESFRRVRDALRAFDEPQLRVQDYEEAPASTICVVPGALPGRPWTS